MSNEYCDICTKDGLQTLECDECVDGSQLTKIKTCDECELGNKENFPCQYGNEPKTCAMNPR